MGTPEADRLDFRLNREDRVHRRRSGPGRPEHSGATAAPMCGVYETRELESAVGISVGGYVARSPRSILYSHTPYTGLRCP